MYRVGLIIKPFHGYWVSILFYPEQSPIDYQQGLEELIAELCTSQHFKFILLIKP
jgi:hypothetical protein